MTLAKEQVKGLHYPIKYRGGTHDRYIIERVVESNMYGLPADMKGQLVIDIGAHVGSFACLAATRGARVLAFEPYSENYEILSENASVYDGIDTYRVEPYRGAVVGEERDEKGRLKFRGIFPTTTLYIHQKNTGCHSINRMDWKPEDFEPATTETVPTITLQRIFNALRFFAFPKLQCNFLKMDCEGAEEGILTDILSPLFDLLPRIDRMGVEFHSEREIDWAIPCLEAHFDAKPVSKWEWQFEKRKTA